jgi:anaerobic ribonucleoside-triphosphate reductase activating protein
LLENPGCRALLEQVDVLVDGRFVEALRDEELCFRGSSNQRIIDVAKSLQQGHAVILEEYS